MVEVSGVFRDITHGSYRNRVNVRQDSDVDIGVVCYDTFFPTYPEGLDGNALGHVAATYHHPAFKFDLQEVLIDYLGAKSVRRGNKAFDLSENSYRVEADVVPLFEHRRYTSRTNYISGVVLYPDNGPEIVNWPEQHYPMFNTFVVRIHFFSTLMAGKPNDFNAGPAEFRM